jgi:ribosomal protein L11 methyltransferase
MRYHCLHIHTDFAEEWQKDVFDQQICELGVDTIDGEDYYIPSDLWKENQAAIRELLSTIHCQISVDEIADENWNAVWEAEHPLQELPLGVKIIPHCAFGAGHHETTSMMIDALIEHLSTFDFEPSGLSAFSVLDNGCGTGVLGIFAKKLGASHVLALDIDDKSVENTLENAALNGVEIDAKLGDLSSFDFRLSTFDLILANIHRNILLAQMPIYARIIKEQGEVWISGFYEEDCPALIEAAEAHGLHHRATRSNGEWRMIQFCK